MVEAHPRSILPDIPSGPETVFIFKEFKSWYTSALEQDILGNSSMIDGRFELVEKLDVKKRFNMFALADGVHSVPQCENHWLVVEEYVDGW